MLLLPDEVQVHFFSTDLPPASLEVLLSLLSEKERQRAERFHFARDRDRYIAAHAGLRLLLTRSGAGSPGSLVFERGLGGKPRLAAGPRFSLSHAGGMAAVAVSATLEVGVDLEVLLPEEDPELFAAVCGFEERLFLNSLPPPERPWAFTRLWVVKEALVKAQGSGLRIPLSALAIALADEGLRIAPPAWNGVKWFAAELAPPPGYAGALATLHRAPASVKVLSYKRSEAFFASP